MFGATAATIVLFTTGLSAVTVAMAVFTTACTVLSRTLYRTR